MMIKPKRKTLYCMGGAIACGKSTTTVNFVDFFELNHLKYVSSDICTIVGFRSDFTSDQGKDYEMGRELSYMKRERLLKKGESFILESLSDSITLPLPGEKEGFISRCKNAGYYICCIFVGVDSVALSQERVELRKASGGHLVSDKKTEERYLKCMNCLPEYIDLADEIMVLDNSTDKFKLQYYKNEKGNYFTENPAEWFKKYCIEKIPSVQTF